VSGVGDERLFTLQRRVLTGEQLIQGHGQSGHFVLRRRNGQTSGGIVGLQFGGLSSHPFHRPQRPTGQKPCSSTGQGQRSNAHKE